MPAMARNLPKWTVATALAAALGCTETRTYRVSVRNDLDRPVTVCLTKTVGPAEAGWESPEELAGPAYPASDERPPGTVVPPGKTATEGPIPGEFYHDQGQADLRVYLGRPTLTQMNAVSRGSPDRVDVQLRPGVSRLVVQRGDDGRLQAVPEPLARRSGGPAGTGDPGAGD